MMAFPVIVALISSMVSLMNDHLLGIGDYLRRLLLPVSHERLPDTLVVDGDDLGRQDRGVVPAVEPDRCHRDSGRHLHD